MRPATPELAIEVLQKHKVIYELLNPKDRQFMIRPNVIETAIQEISKQFAKTITPNHVTGICECPTCGNEWMMCFSHKYCQNCGQRLEYELTRPEQKGEENWQIL